MLPSYSSPTSEALRSLSLYHRNMAHTIRQATSADLTTIINILATSFRHESYINFLHPHAPPNDEAAFLRDLKRYWRRQVREKWWDSSYRFVVSMKGDVMREVVGVGVWRKPEVLKPNFAQRCTRCVS